MAPAMLLIGATLVPGHGATWRQDCTLRLEEANMKKLDLPLPLFGFIVGTRALLGAGIGLLLADKFPRRTRRSVGATLVMLGALTTIPGRSLCSVRRWKLRGGLRS